MCVCFFRTESRYPGRHIAQKHLKKPLYECPVCDSFGSYECCTVIKHIQKVHPTIPANTPPVSKLEEYADEIRELQLKCFPNRQMKLIKSVSTANGFRQRERQNCKICRKLITQSERQRHVYHRHLNRLRLFECPLCDFSSNYDVHRVKWHLKWQHREKARTLKPISHEARFRDEIEQLNVKCFDNWQHRRKESDEDESTEVDESGLKEGVDLNDTEMDLLEHKRSKLDTVGVSFHSKNNTFFVCRNPKMRKKKWIWTSKKYRRRRTTIGRVSFAKRIFVLRRVC